MRKRGHLYTVNKWNRKVFAQGVDRQNNNIFDGMQGSSLQMPSGTPSSYLSTNGGGVSGTYTDTNARMQSALSTDVKGWNSSNAGSSSSGSNGFSMQGMQDMAGAAKPMFDTLGGLISGGKTSTAGNVIKSIGAADPTGLTSFVGDVVNAMFGSKMNDANISRYNSENAANASLAVDASSNQSVTDAFNNFTYLEGINQDDVGSDGWFSDKAKDKTAELNEQRRQANAHAMSALAQSVTDLDSNKDDDILTSYAALGGKLHHRDEKTKNLFAAGGAQDNWWGQNGKQMMFGNLANGKSTSSGWGGKDNASAYLSAATDIVNTAANWGDENYNSQTLGTSGTGLIGSSYAALNNALKKSRHENDVPLSRRIGLAYGGRLGGKKNLFASGGDYAKIAASAVKLYNNAVIQAKRPDISSYTNALQNQTNWDYKGVSSTDALAEMYGNSYKQYNDGVTGQQLRGNKSWGEDIMDSGQASLEGAQAGSAFGPVGTAIGAIVGGVSSLIGSNIGRNRAKGQARALNKQINAANARQTNSMIYQSNSLDRANDIQAKALDYALGGELNTDNMGAIEYDLLNSYFNGRGRRPRRQDSTFFDRGGLMEELPSNHGADWQSRYKNINAGGSHEENPNDGVQMGVDNEGTPNLVEEGEVVWNDYVFSNRIEVPKDILKQFGMKGKKTKTFADAAKQLEKEIKDRPNDPISKAGIDDNMEMLAEAQEQVKKQRQAEEAKAEFEAMSPEEQLAVMQGIKEQQAQQEAAAQEQAMAEQQAAEQGQQVMQGEQGQQLSPEEQQMVAEQQMQQQGNINALGGQINTFDDGGTWDWAKFFDFTNKFSKKPAYTAEDKYMMDSIYPGNVGDVEAGNSYKSFTDYILNKATTEERKKYFKWIDENTGNKTGKYIDKDGNLVSNWKEKYQKARTDGIWGIQHYTPQWRETAKQVTKHTPQIFHAVEGDDDYLPSNEKDWVGVGKEIRRVITPEGDTIIYHSPTEAVTEDNSSNKTKGPKILPGEWLQYAGALGPAVGLGLWAAGVGKPDTSGLEAAVSKSNVAPIRAEYRPLGDYLRFNPLDINYQQNKQNAQTRATDRAIQNTAGTRGAATAAMLANDYNGQLASGQLFRNALEYNDAQRQKVAEFNKGTNQFNAQAFNTAALQYANDYNNQKRFNAQLAYQAAKDKMDADAAWYSSLYGNIGNLGTALGKIGEDRANKNFYANMFANELYGTYNPDEPYAGMWTTWNNGKKKSKKYGGKVRRRKGMTF